MLCNFSKNTEYFDDQIDLINEELDKVQPVGELEKKIYMVAKPVTKAVLYVKASLNLFRD